MFNQSGLYKLALPLPVPSHLFPAPNPRHHKDKTTFCSMSGRRIKSRHEVNKKQRSGSQRLLSNEASSPQRSPVRLRSHWHGNLKLLRDLGQSAEDMMPLNPILCLVTKKWGKSMKYWTVLPGCLVGIHTCSPAVHTSVSAEQMQLWYIELFRCLCIRHNTSRFVIHVQTIYLYLCQQYV